MYADMKCERCGCRWTVLVHLVANGIMQLWDDERWCPATCTGRGMVERVYESDNVP